MTEIEFKFQIIRFWKFHTFVLKLEYIDFHQINIDTGFSMYY